jgi:hypothetical protein
MLEMMNTKIAIQEAASGIKTKEIILKGQVTRKTQVTEDTRRRTLIARGLLSKPISLILISISRDQVAIMTNREMADAMMTMMMKTIIQEEALAVTIRPSLILIVTLETKARRTIIKGSRPMVPSSISMIIRANSIMLDHHSRNHLILAVAVINILVNTTRTSLLLDLRVKWLAPTATLLAHVYKKSKL